jgi:beta-mannanase
MKYTLFIFLVFSFTAQAQLKFLVEDFEGMSDVASDIKAHGIFAYGNIKANIDSKMNGRIYSGKRCIHLTKEEKKPYGGWGMGLGLNVPLDVSTDCLNFYLYANDTCTIRIELEEDDNGDNVFEKETDDVWIYFQKVEIKNTWQLISIPLNKFVDENKGGDGIFNINYKEGRLFGLIFGFEDAARVTATTSWSFDFICFSKWKLQTGKELFDAPVSVSEGCSLGALSEEGKAGNFFEMAAGFEKNFDTEKKLGVVHFFQPFAVDGSTTPKQYPSVERINKVFAAGYIPMITLEDHYVNANQWARQPNLYSITEGHFDTFISAWARQIKQVKGTVLLRILHEFNGDWYPWCVSKNDKNPEMLVKAYRHIHDIFEQENVTNVRFIWCPNSMSVPQEKWNYIMDAYPGDTYVDFVGLDIYNGAGISFLWRSFRKEAIENYFILTQLLPGKPLLICEVASRERKASEPQAGQTKAEWIEKMSEALKTDFTKVKLISWFNAEAQFKINSSRSAQNAFQKFIMNDDYFFSGTSVMQHLMDR